MSTGSEFSEPFTVHGNRNFVRILLFRKDRAFARALNTAVIQLSPPVIPAREYELDYDGEAELQNWMNQIRSGRPLTEVQAELIEDITRTVGA